MRSWIELNSEALNHNLKNISEFIGPKVRYLIVLKANAYGHGLKEIARIILKTSHGKNFWFGVDSKEEGILLRSLRINNPILILGFVPPNDIEEAVANQLHFTVYRQDILRHIAKAGNKLNQIVPVHLKLETGTYRQGISKCEIEKMVKFILKEKWLKLEGVSSHLASRENYGDKFSEIQLKIFDKYLNYIQRFLPYRPICHIASTAAALLDRESHFDMVRIGIGLYGLWPAEWMRKKLPTLKLDPVLSFKTRIAQIKRVPKGARIGYGGTEKAKKSLKLAVLPVGYADGLDRRLSRKGQVLLGGKRCKIMGRVCMNMTMVDVTEVKNINTNSIAVLIGKQGNDELTASHMAKLIGTISYEVVSRLSPSIPRLIL